jgi:hypothetical protein
VRKRFNPGYIITGGYAPSYSYNHSYGSSLIIERNLWVLFPPYSTKYVEEEFCELRLYGFLGNGRSAYPDRGPAG